jgi:hypothetical protein
VALVVESRCSVPVPNLQPISAAGAILLLLVSMAWWLLSAPEVIDPGRPKWQGEDIVQLRADVPETPDFLTFYVNDDNPFVPVKDRRKEVDQRSHLKRPPIVPQPPPPHSPPGVIVKPNIPPLKLPKISAPSANAPIVYGMLAVNGAQVVFVRMPGAETSLKMSPGDKAGGWTLIAIDHGNIAIFTDPQGVEQRFAIGDGDFAIVQDLGSGDTTPEKSGTGKPGVPKPPSSRLGNKPPGTPGSKTGDVLTRPRPPIDRPRPPDRVNVPPTQLPVSPK